MRTEIKWTTESECSLCAGAGFYANPAGFMTRAVCFCVQAQVPDPVIDPEAPIWIVVNARTHETVPGNVATYEHLVHVAGMTGQPSMTVRFPDGRGRIVSSGQEIELVDGLVVTCVHTGNA